MYLGRDARYMWQSCCTPDAMMKTGTLMIVLGEGAENVMFEMTDCDLSSGSTQTDKLR